MNDQFCNRDVAVHPGPLPGGVDVEPFADDVRDGSMLNGENGVLGQPRRQPAGVGIETLSERQFIANGNK
jgi:hypothetical protein